MDVTIIVTTFGEEKWRALAHERAIPSAQEEAPTRSFHVDSQGISLGAARNAAVDFHDPQDWLCFMDADDELEPGYMEAMSRQERHPSVKISDLLAPALCYQDAHGRGRRARLKHRDIMYMNPCPIGTLIHRDTFENAGRFWDEPAWEDWSLFRRAYILDSNIVFIDDALYISHVDPKGRNSRVRDNRRLNKEIIRSHRTWALKHGNR